MFVVGVVQVVCKVKKYKTKTINKKFGCGISQETALKTFPEIQSKDT